MNGPRRCATSRVERRGGAVSVCRSPARAVDRASQRAARSGVFRRRRGGGGRALQVRWRSPEGRGRSIRLRGSLAGSRAPSAALCRSAARCGRGSATGSLGPEPAASLGGAGRPLPAGASSTCSARDKSQYITASGARAAMTTAGWSARLSAAMCSSRLQAAVASPRERLLGSRTAPKRNYSSAAAPLLPRQAREARGRMSLSGPLVEGPPRRACRGHLDGRREGHDGTCRPEPRMSSANADPGRPDPFETRRRRARDDDADRAASWPRSANPIAWTSGGAVVDAG
jgi:hypothetical protein